MVEISFVIKAQLDIILEYLKWRFLSFTKIDVYYSFERSLNKAMWKG